MQSSPSCCQQRLPACLFLVWSVPLVQLPLTGYGPFLCLTCHAHQPWNLNVMNLAVQVVNGCLVSSRQQRPALHAAAASYPVLLLSRCSVANLQPWATVYCDFTVQLGLRVESATCNGHGVCIALYQATQHTHKRARTRTSSNQTSRCTCVCLWTSIILQLCTTARCGYTCFTTPPCVVWGHSPAHPHNSWLSCMQERLVFLVPLVQ